MSKIDADAEAFIGCGCLVVIAAGFILVILPVIICLWRFALS